MQVLLSRQGLGETARCLSQARLAQLWWLLPVLRLLLGQGWLLHCLPQARLGLRLLQVLLWVLVQVSPLHCQPRGRQAQLWWLVHQWWALLWLAQRWCQALRLWVLPWQAW